MTVVKQHEFNEEERNQGDNGYPLNQQNCYPNAATEGIHIIANVETNQV